MKKDSRQKAVFFKKNRLLFCRLFLFIFGRLLHVTALFRAEQYAKVHLFSTPDHPEREEIYHYKREAKVLLSYNIYCALEAQFDFFQFIFHIS